MLDNLTDRRKIGRGQQPKRRARSTEGIDITANN